MADAETVGLGWRERQVEFVKRFTSGGGFAAISDPAKPEPSASVPRIPAEEGVVAAKMRKKRKK